MYYKLIFGLLLITLFTTHIQCAQKDLALERAIAASLETSRVEQNIRALNKKNIKIAKQRSLQLAPVVAPTYYKAKPIKLTWWQRIKQFWSRKRKDSTAKIVKNPKINKNQTTKTIKGLQIYDWSPYAYRQLDGVSCGLHSIKNGYHVAQYLQSEKLDSDYKALIKNIESKPNNPICKFGYPLAEFKKSLGLPPEQKLKEMLFSENVYKTAQDVFKLTKDDITVIASTKNFKSSGFDLGFFFEPEAKTLKKLRESVKKIEEKEKIKPIIHIFVLGNMEELNTVNGMRGTSGHWIALVVEIDKNKQLSFHYINSFGANQSDLEYKVGVIKEFLQQ